METQTIESNIPAASSDPDAKSSFVASNVEALGAHNADDLNVDQDNVEAVGICVNINTMIIV